MAKVIDIQIVGLSDLMTDIAAAGGNAKGLVKAAITNSVIKSQSEMRSLAPHRTGTLQRGILAEVKYPVGVVSVTEKYGEYIEEGTGIYGPKKAPFKITAKRGKALKMMIGGQLVFRRSVMSKGMKAQPFFVPGYEKALPYIYLQFGGVIDKLTRELAGKK